jgi:hypothetical protein
MGKVILDNFLLSQALKSSEIIISTQRYQNLYELKNKYADI